MHYTQVYQSTQPSQNLINWINEMPKVEIHVHLEGATSPELLFEMAKRNKVRLPAANLAEWNAFYEFRDFDHFIEIYMLSVECMKSPQDFMDMVIDFMGRQAQQNIQYSEVFISAALHIHRLPGDEILTALREGARTGKQKYGVDVSFIPDISRETCYKKKLQKDVLEFALKANELGIGIGLGIAGKEIGYPSESFQDIFTEARRQGLHIVAHAGETGDQSVVKNVIDVLKPERIGHGIGALEDPGLVAYLCRHKIPIEVSPQSNYCTRVVKPDCPHPIHRMVNEGLFCTVNTDDPPMFSTDLNNEYLTLASQGFTFSDLWSLNMNGLQAAFIPEDQKEEMSRSWETWLQQVTANQSQL